MSRCPPGVRPAGSSRSSSTAASAMPTRSRISRPRRCPRAAGRRLRRHPGRHRGRSRRAQVARGSRDQPPVGQAHVRARRAVGAASRRGGRRGPLQRAVQTRARGRARSPSRWRRRRPGSRRCPSSSPRPVRWPRSGPTGSSAPRSSRSPAAACRSRRPPPRRPLRHPHRPTARAAAPTGVDPSGVDPSGVDPSSADPSSVHPTGVDVSLPPAGIVRAWALGHGHPVAPKGRVPAHVVRAYVSEHGGTRQGASREG